MAFLPLKKLTLKYCPTEKRCLRCTESMKISVGQIAFHILFIQYDNPKSQNTSDMCLDGIYVQVPFEKTQ